MHVIIPRMVKTIAVSDDVYKKLKKAGMPGESFSSIIRRNLERRPKLSELAGRRTYQKGLAACKKGTR